MFSWSRGEMWLAVVLSALLVLGGAGHLWLSYVRLQGATVVVEAAAGPDPADGAESADETLPSAAGESDPTDAPGVESVDTRININTASASELQRLPGIGPALAARIIEYRKAWGPFAKVEDIMEVSGIGPRKFEDIKNLIKVD